MTSKVSKDIKQPIIRVLRKKIVLSHKKVRKDFILNVLWHILSIKDIANFTQLGQFSPYCELITGSICEQEFDILAFNKLLCERLIDKDRILAFDPSYIPKPGNLT